RAAVFTGSERVGLGVGATAALLRLWKSSVLASVRPVDSSQEHHDSKESFVLLALPQPSRGGGSFMSAVAAANRDLWTDALGRLEGRLSPQNFDMWLRPLECVSCDRGIVRLRAPNSYVRLWFESNFLDTVLSELRAASGDEFAVEFEPDGPDVVPRPIID